MALYQKSKLILCGHWTVVAICGDTSVWIKVVDRHNRTAYIVILRAKLLCLLKVIFYNHHCKAWWALGSTLHHTDGLSFDNSFPNMSIADIQTFQVWNVTLGLLLLLFVHFLTSVSRIFFDKTVSCETNNLSSPRIVCFLSISLAAGCDVNCRISVGCDRKCFISEYNWNTQCLVVKLAAVTKTCHIT